MSYTNSTPNLHLPQYIATDKPTYLGDWNESMQTIDTAMTATQAAANGANSTAVSANATASAAQATANSAVEKSNNNETEIEKLNSLFQLTSPKYTPGSNLNAALKLSYNSFILYASGNCSQIGSKPVGVVVGTNTRIPLFSFEGNPLNLVASLISDNNNKANGGPVIITDEDNIYNALSSFFYDGTNTILYFYLPTTIYSGISNISNVYINSITLYNID